MPRSDRKVAPETPDGGFPDGVGGPSHSFLKRPTSPTRMAEERPGEPIGRRLRTFLRSHRFPFSLLVLAIGVFLTVLAIGFYTPLNTVPFFQSLNTATNTPTANYNLVFVLAGPIITIIGAYFVGAYYLARRRFEHLMETRSKAEFLRNLPEVEDLLWDLTPIDERRYAEKKAELRIRR
jgi:hypothetical protein